LTIYVASEERLGPEMAGSPARTITLMNSVIFFSFGDTHPSIELLFQNSWRLALFEQGS
jgi:hypothetical protein